MPLKTIRKLTIYFENDREPQPNPIVKKASQRRFEEKEKLKLKF